MPSGRSSTRSGKIWRSERGGWRPNVDPSRGRERRSGPLARPWTKTSPRSELTGRIFGRTDTIPGCSERLGGTREGSEGGRKQRETPRSRDDRQVAGGRREVSGDRKSRGRAGQAPTGLAGCV